MLGETRHWELRLSALIDHAAREHGTREVVCRWADGSEARSSWAGVRHDAMRLAHALCGWASRSATDKISKKDLRERLGGYRLPGA